ncbi:MAG: plasmid pRiA4b family protein [Mucilaginibacter sp.]|nr:plasmid pRiA4b family protein [Mucilaginibacter sp.]
MQTLQFKIQIQDIQKPPVWRRVLVPDDITFDEFHQIIQTAFGWEDCHLYQFSKNGWSSELIYKIPDEYDDDETTQDSRITFLSEVFTIAKQTFAYIYDFGDNWKHYIILEEISDTGKTIPMCLAGKGACPPEDCGGIPAIIT